jgi:hypothetical protein
MQKEVVWQNSDQRECTLQLRKKYMTKNMREVCQLDSNTVVQALSSALNVQTSRILASFVRNSRHEARGLEVQFQRQSFGSVPPEMWL